MTSLPDGVVEISDRAGAKVQLRRVNGLLYPHDPMFDNFKHGLENLKKFQFRPNDVITMAFPRSGSHWSYEIVSMVMNRSASYTAQHMGKRMVSLVTDEELAQFDQEPSPRQFQSHLRLSNFPDNLPEVKPRLIYMIRNPKDVLWSTYKLASIMTTMIMYRGEWDNFLELPLTGEFMYGSWFDHVLDCEHFMDSHPDVPVHILCYEHMKMNPAQEIQRLAEYLLGQPLDQALLAEIVDKVQFSNMKKELDTSKKMVEFQGDRVEKGSSGILRKGEIGEWKNWFSKEQSDAVDKVFEEKMSKSKLGALMKPFIEF